MVVLSCFYKEGRIQLLEPIPPFLADPQPITVTFQNGISKKSDDNPAISAALSLIGLLDSLTPEQSAEFDNILEERGTFVGPREVEW